MYHEIKDLPKEKLKKILQFVSNLPLYFTVENFIFTHAGANVAKPIESNAEYETIWMNQSFPSLPGYPGKVLVFGHTPTWQFYNDNKINRKNTKIWYDSIHKDKICVDCGGVFGGRLAALELPTYREFYE